MDFTEKIKNDQLLIVIKKLAFLGELKKYFYEKDLISLEAIPPIRRLKIYFATK